jgi:octaprenyl-diphosphate synthase
MAEHPKLLQLAYQLAHDDLQAVDALIKSQLEYELPLVKNLCEHILGSGGKRIRPLLSILSAKACNYPGRFHINLAVTLEFFHTASLLHDDVVDNSDLRRGQKAAHILWDNKITILVGDFLFSRALQVMNQTDNLKVCHIIANTANIITQGEVVQLENRRNFAISNEIYMNIIRKKTGALFAATTELSAVVANASQAQTQALHDYGMEIGTAFQIIDDALDYQGDITTIGKNIGDDLNEGKLTLPLMLSLQQANATERARIETCLNDPKPEYFPDILALIKAKGAIAQCQEVAKQHQRAAMRALDALPPSVHRDALAHIAEFVVARES